MKSNPGDQIRELMERRGINQIDLARETGVSQSMISKIISGHRRGDSSTVRRIENALGAKPGILSAKGSTLRGVLKYCEECERRFVEAESLAKSIFSRKKYPKLVALPFFAEHGNAHCLAVEMYLNEIIWDRKEKSRYDFIPNAEEAMYLLSAVWLHDIGMSYGLWDNEDPDELKNAYEVIQLRGEHEQRAADYIQERWGDACYWTVEQKEYLASLCFYHRSKHPLSTLEPVTIGGHHGDVRLNVLSALLRLAVAWDVAAARPPSSLENLYISLGMPGDARLHWDRAGLIRSVEKYDVDVSRKLIRIIGHYPHQHLFELGEFDLRDVGDMVCQDVRRELRSVQQILVQYPNTSFTEVKHEIRRMHLAGANQRYLALWPYLLNKLTSSTETSAGLVEVLLFATEAGLQNKNSDAGWRNDVLKIVDKMWESYRFDFMIRNLCKDVEVELGRKSTSAKSFSKYLKGVKRRIKDNRDKMAEHAIEIIEPRDCLVIYCFSTNTLRLLEEVPQKRIRELYIVECYREMGARQKEDEDDKVVKKIQDLGFRDVRFVHLHGLAQALGELKRKKRVCKVLLGTHGVIKDVKTRRTKEYVCKPGSYIVATIAKESKVAEIVIFADNQKVLRNGFPPKDIIVPDELFSWDHFPRHPQLGIPYLPPAMDIVPMTLVDFVVTEEGVLSGKDWRREKKVLSKTMEKGQG